MAADSSSCGDRYRSHLAGEGEKDTVWRHVRRRERPLRGRAHTGVAGRVAGGDDAERDQDVGDGAVAQGAAVGLQVGEPRPVQPVRERRTGEETLAVGSYNALLTSPILASTGAYDAAKETFASSHELFRSALPRGFAWEVLKVYSGPPVIVFKFRHWGHMEGPYKGHAPTGEKVEFHGVAVVKVDEQLRAEDVEVYYDPGELLGGLIKGPEVASSEEERAERLSEGGNPSEAATVSASGADQPPQGCPFFSAGKTK